MVGGKGKGGLSFEPGCLIIFVCIVCVWVWGLHPSFLLILNLGREKVVTYLILKTQAVDTEM